MAIYQINDTSIPVKLWTAEDSVEEKAVAQLRTVANLPWTFHHVAAMPDVHAGEGATIGSVIAMRGAVSPSAVGVDIGCGMGAVRTSIYAQDLQGVPLREIRLAIEAVIPVGFKSYERPAYLEASDEIRRQAEMLMMEFASLPTEVQEFHDRASLQLGTLGSGNHFIELCLDEDDRVWLMLHSGSRNIGLRLANHHVAIAKTLGHNKNLPDMSLSVFLDGTPEMESYRRTLDWGLRYAALNRQIMMERYQNVLRTFFPKIRFHDGIFCHHNYSSEEVHFGEKVFVTRKGAISARDGEYGIIPGSMGARSYIVKGLGNPESYCSASHGAGRAMSRTAARNTFTIADLEAQTAGIECRKDEDVLDEAPGAYKDIDVVMANQSDLVRPIATLHQVLCIKGGEADPKRKKRKKKVETN